MQTLRDMLRAEIVAAGSVSFARFMEAALYAPGRGYYERRPGRIGRGGDYFTSVSVGPVFGELLAVRFAHWLRDLGPVPGPRQLVELGAHDGCLARDLLDAFTAHAPDLLPRLKYLVVDPSPTRRAWQAETLQPYRERVRWINDLAELAPGAVAGVIFGNEFFDALPVHRLGWDAAARTWFEWHVGWDGQRFCWVRAGGESGKTLPAAVRAALAAEYPLLDNPAVQAALPDAYTVEVCPAARAVWAAAARALGAGWLVAIDYGSDPARVGLPVRPDGTLRGYTAHRQQADVLADPGEQDLTADVNFTALRSVGEQAGLQTVGLLSQGRFLVEVLRQTALAEHWDPARRRQFQTLIHPQHLGERFKVLIQTRPPPWK